MIDTHRFAFLVSLLTIAAAAPAAEQLAAAGSPPTAAVKAPATAAGKTAAASGGGAAKGPAAPSAASPNTTPPSVTAKLDSSLITAQLETLGSLPKMVVPAPADVQPGDWPMWGGTTARNNVALAKNIATEWEVGGFDDKTGEWQKSKAQNVKWCSRLGSQSYGNPVVANGKVYVGSNNGAGYLKRYPATVDLGVLLCFDEADGKFLWQHSNEKLPTGRVHDWPLQGVCATSFAEGSRVWYISNRGEVVCLDANGFYDDVDNGPVVNQPAKMFEIMKNEDPAKDQFAEGLAALKEGKLAPRLRDAFAAAGLEIPDDVKLAVEKTTYKFSFKPEGAKHERAAFVRVEGPKLVGYKILNPDDKTEADVIWSVNMMTDLGVSQHNMCAAR